MRKPKPPTARQERELRRLAAATGTSFTPPRSVGEASAQITRMRALTRSALYEVREDVRSVRREVGCGDAAAVRRDEIAGYGSSARWRAGGDS
jgi:hypothetical protein